MQEYLESQENENDDREALSTYRCKPGKKKTPVDLAKLDAFTFLEGQDPFGLLEREFEANIAIQARPDGGKKYMIWFSLEGQSKGLQVYDDFNEFYDKETGFPLQGRAIVRLRHDAELGFYLEARDKMTGSVISTYVRLPGQKKPRFVYLGKWSLIRWGNGEKTSDGKGVAPQLYRHTRPVAPLSQYEKSGPQVFEGGTELYYEGRNTIFAGMRELIGKIPLFKPVIADNGEYLVEVHAAAAYEEDHQRPADYIYYFDPQIKKPILLFSPHRFLSLEKSARAGRRLLEKFPQYRSVIYRALADCLVSKNPTAADKHRNLALLNCFKAMTAEDRETLLYVARKIARFFSSRSGYDDGEWGSAESAMDGFLRNLPEEFLYREGETERVKAYRAFVGEAGQSSDLSNDVHFFIREAYSHKLLSPLGEIYYAMKYHMGDESARETLVHANLRLLLFYARKFGNTGFDLMDLVHAGYGASSEGEQETKIKRKAKGLAAAVEMWNPGYGTTLGTYLSVAINRSMADHIARHRTSIRVPKEALEKWYDFREDLAEANRLTGKKFRIDGPLVPDELAQYVNGAVGSEWTGRNVRDIRHAANAQALSVDAPKGEDDDRDLHETVEAPEGSSPERQLKDEFFTYVFDLMERSRRFLPDKFPKACEIVKLKYDNDPVLTNEDIGDLLGVTRSRVQQVLSRVERILRAAVEREGLDREDFAEKWFQRGQETRDRRPTVLTRSEKRDENAATPPIPGNGEGVVPTIPGRDRGQEAGILVPVTKIHEFTQTIPRIAEAVLDASGAEAQGSLRKIFGRETGPGQYLALLSDGVPGVIVHRNGSGDQIIYAGIDSITDDVFRDWTRATHKNFGVQWQLSGPKYSLSAVMESGNLTGVHVSMAAGRDRNKRNRSKVLPYERGTLEGGLYVDGSGLVRAEEGSSPAYQRFARALNIVSGHSSFEKDVKQALKDGVQIFFQDARLDHVSAPDPWVWIISRSWVEPWEADSAKSLHFALITNGMEGVKYRSFRSRVSAHSPAGKGLSLSASYKTLNLPEGASKEEVKKAFREKALRYLPELNDGNEDGLPKFHEAKAAYEVILRNFRAETRSQEIFLPPGFDPDAPVRIGAIVADVDNTVIKGDQILSGANGDVFTEALERDKKVILISGSPYHEHYDGGDFSEASLRRRIVNPSRENLRRKDAIGAMRNLRVRYIQGRGLVTFDEHAQESIHERTDKIIPTETQAQMGRLLAAALICKAKGWSVDAFWANPLRTQVWTAVSGSVRDELKRLEQLVKQETGFKNVQFWAWGNEFSFVFFDPGVPEGAEVIQTALAFKSKAGYGFSLEDYLPTGGGNFAKFSTLLKKDVIAEELRALDFKGAVLAAGDSATDDFLKLLPRAFTRPFLFLPVYFGPARDMAGSPHVIVARDEHGQDNIKTKGFEPVLRAVLEAEDQGLTYRDLKIFEGGRYSLRDLEAQGIPIHNFRTEKRDDNAGTPLIPGNGGVPTRTETRSQSVDKVVKEVVKARERRVTLIGGPSGAGKTTLIRALKAGFVGAGSELCAISVDNYIRPTDELPLFLGKPSFEHPGSYAHEKVIRHAESLLAGVPVMLPRDIFDENAVPEISSLAPGGVLGLDGLHTLSPLYYDALASYDPLSIFYSAHSTLRFLRRIKRDMTVRQYHDPLGILRIWRIVLATENDFVLPTRERAHYLIDHDDPNEELHLYGELEGVLRDLRRREEVVQDPHLYSILDDVERRISEIRSIPRAAGDKPRTEKRTLRTQIVPSSKLEPLTAGQVEREFKALVDSGVEFKVPGKAKEDPRSLLSLGYTPKYKIKLFDTTYYLSNVRKDGTEIPLVAYVVQKSPQTGKPVIYARLFYKDYSMIWRSASHFRGSEAGIDWFGKGDFEPFSKSGLEHLYSMEETTNLPLEIQSALDEVGTKVENPKVDFKVAYRVLRGGMHERSAPYADFTKQRALARQNKRNLINGGKLIAFFDRKNDPSTLKFVDGYEPDFKAGIVEVSQDPGPRTHYYGGTLTKYRILSKNRKVQYQFVSGPQHTWVNPPQALTTGIMTYGVRSTDVFASDDLFVPGFDYHYTEDDGTPYSQIPAGYAGKLNPYFEYLADASAWHEKLPVIRQFKREVLARGIKTPNFIFASKTRHETRAIRSETRRDKKLDAELLWQRAMDASPVLREAQENFDRSGAAAISNKQYWDGIIDGFEPGKERDARHPDVRKYMRKFLAGLPSGKQSSIFEVGMGYGRSLEIFREEGYADLSGVDIAAEATERVRGKFGEDAASPRFFTGDFVDLDLEQQYDGVFASDVLLYLSPFDQFRAFLKIKAMLKPGGSLFIRMAPGKNEVAFKLDKVTKEPRGWVFLVDQAYLRAMLEAAGLKVDGAVEPITLPINIGTPDSKGQDYLITFARSSTAGVEEIAKLLTGIPDLKERLALPHYNSKWHREGGEPPNQPDDAKLEDHVQKILDSLDGIKEGSLIVEDQFLELIVLVLQQLLRRPEDLYATALIHDLGMMETAEQKENGDWSFHGHEEALLALLRENSVQYHEKDLSPEVLLAAQYHDMHWKIDYEKPGAFEELVKQMRRDFKGSDAAFIEAVKFMVAFSTADTLGSVREGGQPGDLGTVLEFYRQFQKEMGLAVAPTSENESPEALRAAKDTLVNELKKFPSHRLSFEQEADEKSILRKYRAVGYAVALFGIIPFAYAVYSLWGPGVWFSDFNGKGYHLFTGKEFIAKEYPILLTYVLAWLGSLYFIPSILKYLKRRNHSPLWRTLLKTKWREMLSRIQHGGAAEYSGATPPSSPPKGVLRNIFRLFREAFTASPLKKLLRNYIGAIILFSVVEILTLARMAQNIGHYLDAYFSHNNSEMVLTAQIFIWLLPTLLLARWSLWQAQGLAKRFLRIMVTDKELELLSLALSQDRGSNIDDADQRFAVDPLELANIYIDLPVLFFQNAFRIVLFSTMLAQLFAWGFGIAVLSLVPIAIITWNSLRMTKSIPGLVEIVSQSEASNRGKLVTVFKNMSFHKTRQIFSQIIEILCDSFWDASEAGIANTLRETYNASVNSLSTEIAAKLPYALILLLVGMPGVTYGSVVFMLGAVFVIQDSARFFSDKANDFKRLFAFTRRIEREEASLAGEEPPRSEVRARNVVDWPFYGGTLYQQDNLLELQQTSAEYPFTVIFDLFGMLLYPDPQYPPREVAGRKLYEKWLPKEGAIELVRSIREKGGQIVLWSDMDRPFVEANLREHLSGAAGLFDLILTGENDLLPGKQGLPGPEQLIPLFRSLGLSADLAARESQNFKPRLKHASMIFGRGRAAIFDDNPEELAELSAASPFGSFLVIPVRTQSPTVHDIFGMEMFEAWAQAHNELDLGEGMMRSLELLWDDGDNLLLDERPVELPSWAEAREIPTFEELCAYGDNNVRMSDPRSWELSALDKKNYEEMKDWDWERLGNEFVALFREKCFIVLNDLSLESVGGREFLEKFMDQLVYGMKGTDNAEFWFPGEGIDHYWSPALHGANDLMALLVLKKFKEQGYPDPKATYEEQRSRYRVLLICLREEWDGLAAEINRAENRFQNSAGQSEQAFRDALPAAQEFEDNDEKFGLVDAAAMAAENLAASARASGPRLSAEGLAALRILASSEEFDSFSRRMRESFVNCLAELYSIYPEVTDFFAERLVVDANEFVRSACARALEEIILRRNADVGATILGKIRGVAEGTRRDWAWEVCKRIIEGAGKDHGQSHGDLDEDSGRATTPAVPELPDAATKAQDGLAAEINRAETRSIPTFTELLSQKENKKILSDPRDWQLSELDRKYYAEIKTGDVEKLGVELREFFRAEIMVPINDASLLEITEGREFLIKFIDHLVFWEKESEPEGIWHPGMGMDHYWTPAFYATDKMIASILIDKFEKQQVPDPKAKFEDYLSRYRALLVHLAEEWDGLAAEINRAETRSTRDEDVQHAKNLLNFVFYGGEHRSPSAWAIELIDQIAPELTANFEGMKNGKYPVAVIHLLETSLTREWMRKNLSGKDGTRFQTWARDIVFPLITLYGDNSAGELFPVLKKIAKELLAVGSIPKSSAGVDDVLEGRITLHLTGIYLRPESTVQEQLLMDPEIQDIFLARYHASVQKKKNLQFFHESQSVLTIISEVSKLAPSRRRARILQPWIDRVIAFTLEKERGDRFVYYLNAAEYEKSNESLLCRLIALDPERFNNEPFLQKLLDPFFVKSESGYDQGSVPALIALDLLQKKLKRKGEAFPEGVTQRLREFVNEHPELAGIMSGWFDRSRIPGSPVARKFLKQFKRRSEGRANQGTAAGQDQEIRRAGWTGRVAEMVAVVRKHPALILVAVVPFAWVPAAVVYLVHRFVMKKQHFASVFAEISDGEGTQEILRNSEGQSRGDVLSQDFLKAMLDSVQRIYKWDHEKGTAVLLKPTIREILQNIDAGNWGFFGLSAEQISKLQDIQTWPKDRLSREWADVCSFQFSDLDRMLEVLSGLKARGALPENEAKEYAPDEWRHVVYYALSNYALLNKNLKNPSLDDSNRRLMEDLLSPTEQQMLLAIEILRRWAAPDPSQRNEVRGEKREKAAIEKIFKGYLGEFQRRKRGQKRWSVEVEGRRVSHNASANFFRSDSEAVRGVAGCLSCVPLIFVAGSGKEKTMSLRHYTYFGKGGIALGEEPEDPYDFLRILDELPADARTLILTYDRSHREYYEKIADAFLLNSAEGGRVLMVEAEAGSDRAAIVMREGIGLSSQLPREKERIAVLSWKEVDRLFNDGPKVELSFGQLKLRSETRIKNLAELEARLSEPTVAVFSDAHANLNKPGELGEQARKLSRYPAAQPIQILGENVVSAAREERNLRTSADEVFSFLGDFDEGASKLDSIDPSRLKFRRAEYLSDAERRVLDIAESFDMFSVHGNLIWDRVTRQAILITGAPATGKSNITSRMIGSERFSLRADDGVVAYFDEKGVLQASYNFYPAKEYPPSRRTLQGEPESYASASDLENRFVPVGAIVHLTRNKTVKHSQVTSGRLDKYFNDDLPEDKIDEDKENRIRESDILGINVAVPREGLVDFDTLTAEIIRRLPDRVVDSVDASQISQPRTQPKKKLFVAGAGIGKGHPKGDRQHSEASSRNEGRLSIGQSGIRPDRSDARTEMQEASGSKVADSIRAAPRELKESGLKVAEQRVSPVSARSTPGLASRVSTLPTAGESRGNTPGASGRSKTAPAMRNPARNALKVAGKRVPSSNPRSFMDAVMGEDVFFAIDAATLDSLGQGDKLWDELLALKGIYGKNLKILVTGAVTTKKAEKRIAELKTFGEHVFTESQALQLPETAQIIYFTKDAEAKAELLPEEIRKKVWAIFEGIRDADFIAGVEFSLSPYFGDRPPRDARRIMMEHFDFDAARELKLLRDAYFVISSAA